jgi:SnoaL-like domain
MFMQKLPAIALDNAVDPADRVSAIDFIHRVNRLFDAWDIDAMVEAFLPDSVTHHTHGVSRGKAETRRFFQEQSPYLVPGVSPQALSLVVDPDDDDGVIVRYHNLLVRQTEQTASPRIVSGQVVAGPRYAAALDLLRYDGPAAPHRERVAHLRTPRRADIDEQPAGLSCVQPQRGPLRAPGGKLVTSRTRG